MTGSRAAGWAVGDRVLGVVTALELGTGALAEAIRRGLAADRSDLLDAVAVQEEQPPVALGDRLRKRDAQALRVVDAVVDRLDRLVGDLDLGRDHLEGDEAIESGIIIAQTMPTIIPAGVGIRIWCSATNA